MDRLKAADTYSRVNARRVTDLFKEGILAADQNDLTQANLEQSAAQARAQIQVASGALKQAETNLHYTTIISPIDGTVVARNITVGQSVAASLQAPNVFTIAQDLKRMQVYTKTDESDTGDIRAGTEVTFQVDAYPNETFRGRVSAIRLNATIVQNVVTYDAIIDFENLEEKLLPGQTAYVTIPTGFAKDAIKVPNAALRFKPEIPRTELQELYRKNNIPTQAMGQQTRGWQVVWKLAPGGKLEPAAVKVGVTDYNYSQLLEGNLKDGETIVTSQLSGGPAGGPGGMMGGPMGGQRFGGPRP